MANHSELDRPELPTLEKRVMAFTAQLDAFDAALAAQVGPAELMYDVVYSHSTTPACHVYIHVYSTDQDVVEQTIAGLRSQVMSWGATSVRTRFELTYSQELGWNMHLDCLFDLLSLN